MLRVAVPAALAVAALAACGAEEKPAPSPAATTEAKKAKKAPAPRPGTAVHVDGSEFGPMIYGPRNQAIYIFERDSREQDELLRRVRCRVAAGAHPR